MSCLRYKTTCVAVLGIISTHCCILSRQRTWQSWRNNGTTSCRKQECKSEITRYLIASAHSFTRFTSWLSKLSFCLYAHIHLGWTSCLISFVWDQSTCQESVESEKMQKEKFLSTVGLEPTTLDLKSDALPTELAGLVKFCPFKLPYNIHEHAHEKTSLMAFWLQWWHPDAGAL